MRIVRRADFRAVPWKNGGGITHEALRVPADGDRFRWRLSVAEVATSGPFSDFSGYRRTMVLLQGRGLELRFADGTSLLLREPGELVEFDGAARAHGELLAGPCTDLNLIVAKDLPAPGTRVARLEAPLRFDCAAADSRLIFAISGAVEVESAAGGLRARLDPWDLSVLPGSEAGAVTLRSAHGGPAAQVFLAKLSDNP